jgi:hypothetical protein
MTGWTLFYHPMTLSFNELLWMLLPLCASVAITYKTIRTGNLRRLPLEILQLSLYLLVGLAGLGAGLYIIQRLWL